MKKSSTVYLSFTRKKSNHKAQVIEALFIPRQLLAASPKEDTRGRGFLTFDEVYGLYISFFDKPVEKSDFRDQLLHHEYGLRVMGQLRNGKASW